MLENDDTDTVDRLIHAFWDISHIMHETSDGRGSQKRILTVLLRSGTVTQSELTRHLKVQPGSASEVLAKLEAAGLIERHVSPQDRRTVSIDLTVTGKQAAEKARAEREQRKKEILLTLTPAERKELLALLEKITADWKDRIL